MQAPKVDFYILNEANANKAQLFACQLIEKAYKNQQKVYIHANSREEAERLDLLLWTFRDNSFLPHNLYIETNNPAPIQIGFGEKPHDHHGVLVNFTNEIPAFYSQFNTVIEIVFGDAHVQQLARLRYKHYREQGCELNTYKTKASGI